MSHILNWEQMLVKLAKDLTRNDLTPEERLDIESEMEDLENKIDNAYNKHDREEPY